MLHVLVISRSNASLLRNRSLSCPRIHRCTSLISSKTTPIDSNSSLRCAKLLGLSFQISYLFISPNLLCLNNIVAVRTYYDISIESPYQRCNRYSSDTAGELHRRSVWRKMLKDFGKQEGRSKSTGVKLAGFTLQERPAYVNDMHFCFSCETYVLVCCR